MFEGLKTFIDGRQIPDGEEIDCDICLIGSGAAGITIAREFIGQDLKIVILESGGLEYEDSTHELTKLVVTGHEYPVDKRLRFFGGTTNHWGGHCVPLRSHNFARRDWIPDGEWPFGLTEVEPYYVRAHEVLEIGPYDYDPKAVANRLGLQLLPLDSRRVETVLSRYNRLLFGYRYRQEVDDAPNISVFLFATVSSIILSDDGRTVTRVDACSPENKSFSFSPKMTVLAAGGIDNARLMLMSNQQISNGIGNQYDVVGRYFQEHIRYNSGFILPVNQKQETIKLYENEIPFDGEYSVRCHLALPETQTQALRIPDYRVELEIDRTYRFHESAVSMHRIRKYLGLLEPELVSLEDMINVVSDPTTSLGVLLGGSEPPLVYGFMNLVEQAPNSESRVRLAVEKDALGMNRAELRWQLSNLDKEGIERAQEVIAAEVGSSGVGRMHIFIPDSEETLLEGARGVGHHMGTTRMHSDPKRGVVDANARVHGVENLFIAGSSIFPSCGFANPTLTIVALSIRLADHLKASFEVRA
jgi:choline dehydrogenase-like flavoprotein